MQEFLAFVGSVLGVMALFMLGYLYGTNDAEKRCADGNPIIIKNAIYRCVKQP